MLCKDSMALCIHIYISLRHNNNLSRMSLIRDPVPVQILACIDLNCPNMCRPFLMYIPLSGLIISSELSLLNDALHCELSPILSILCCYWQFPLNASSWIRHQVGATRDSSGEFHTQVTGPELGARIDTATFDSPIAAPLSNGLRAALEQ